MDDILSHSSKLRPISPPLQLKTTQHLKDPLTQDQPLKVYFQDYPVHELCISICNITSKEDELHKRYQVLRSAVTPIFNIYNTNLSKYIQLVGNTAGKLTKKLYNQLIQQGILKMFTRSKQIRCYIQKMREHCYPKTRILKI